MVRKTKLSLPSILHFSAVATLYQLKMAAKGIFVFVSLCLFAFAFGKPQSQVIMLIMSHNYILQLLRMLALKMMPKYKHFQIPDVTLSGELITGQIT